MSNGDDDHALPSPPSQTLFDQKELADTILPAGSVFFRIHDRQYSPFHYRNDPEYRFDSPGGAYGVMYVSQSRIGAFAETITRQFFDQRLTGEDVLVFESRYVDKVLTKIESVDSMRLLDIFDGPTQSRLGIDGRLMMHSDYSTTREWSERIQAHPHRFDGIRYVARHDSNTRSVAVFDRFDRDMFDVVLKESFEFGLPYDLVDYLDRCGHGLKPL